MDPKIDTDRKETVGSVQIDTNRPSDRHLKKRNVEHRFRKIPIKPQIDTGRKKSGISTNKQDTRRKESRAGSSSRHQLSISDKL